MAAIKKYTWTVSVLAIYDPTDLLQKNAYTEFENSIRNIKTPRKALDFVIFEYNSKDDTARIKKSYISKGKMRLKVVRPSIPVDIYEKSHAELINFFKKYVAWKGPKSEIHKHMFITWGHGSGLGFLREEIEEKIKTLYVKWEKKNTDITRLNSGRSELLRKTSQLVASINSLPSGLTEKEKGIEVKKLLSQNSDIPLPEKFINDEHDEIIKSFRSISSLELADIIKEGLKDDTSTVSVQDNIHPVPGTARIQIMLCLTCYTNTAETIFSFKELVNVFIAPQTGIPFFGYHYNALFKLLNLNPRVNEITISENVTDFYLLKFHDRRIRRHTTDTRRKSFGNIDFRYGVSFAAVYTFYFQIIAMKIRLFKDYIMEQMKHDPDQTKQLLIKSRFRCGNMQPNGLGDLGIIDYENYITEVITRIPSHLRQRNFDSFFFYQHIIADYSPGFLCRSQYWGGKRDFISQSPGSYSIFLPAPGLSPTDPDHELIKLYKQMSNHSDSFLTLTEWSDIIEILNPGALGGNSGAVQPAPPDKTAAANNGTNMQPGDNANAA